MAAKKKNRVMYYDILRAIACFCILTIHFNASFSGFNGEVFLYSNTILPFNIFNNTVYLGSFGVSLFFILSGASMHRAYGNREISLPQFYKKRFFAIFPMFWIAWFVATAVSDLVYGGVAPGGVAAALTTLLGMDGYSLVYGQSALCTFYQVGEWYLGCIILIYLIMPLLLYGVRKRPLITGCVSMLIFVLLCKNASDKFFLLRVPEVVFGMMFDKYFRAQEKRTRAALTVGLICGMVVLSVVGNKFLPDYDFVLCVLISIMFFSAGVLIFQNVQDAPLIRPLIWLAKYSYPIFLVHHQVCEYMSKRFYLPELSRKSLWFSFVVYLLIAAGLAVLLSWVTDKIQNLVKDLISPWVQKEKAPVDLRARWRRGILGIPVAMLIPIQFFGAVPLQLYLGNAGEINVPKSSVLLYCSAFFVLSVVLLTLLGLIFSDKVFSGYCAVLFAGGVLLYLQSNFLFINVGALDGQAFDLSSQQSRILINLILWIMVPIIAALLSITFKNIANQIVKYGSIALSAMQLIVVVLLLITPEQEGGIGTDFIVTAKGFNELSTDKNAVIIVMDMFDDTYMTEVLENEPELAAKLDGFVRYTNVTGKYCSTVYGVPYLITQEPLLNQEADYYNMLERAYQDSDFLHDLIENQYRIQLYTYGIFIDNSFAETCYNVTFDDQYVVSEPVRFCQLMSKLTLLRAAPDIVKAKMTVFFNDFGSVVTAGHNEVYDAVGIRPYQDMMNKSIETVTTPVFSLIHIWGTHHPYKINENAELVDQGSVTYYEQAVGNIRAVTAFLDHMKEAGVYDNSTIILTADHGYGTGDGTISCPALLVKNRNSTGTLMYDDTPVSHDNIQDFILSDADIGYILEQKNEQRIYYSYILNQHGYENELIEWNVSDESNAQESFVRSGYKIDLDGNRVPLSQYLPYQFGNTLYFGEGGNASNYFDYGVGNWSGYTNSIVGSESKMTLSHVPASKDMLLSVEFDNYQTSDCTIAAICNGVNCGEITLASKQLLGQWKIPEECMNADQTEIILRYTGIEQNWVGRANQLHYLSLTISEYNGEDLSSTGHTVTALQDYQSEILSYKIVGSDLLVTVKNTSSAEWTYRNQIKCYLLVDGQDSGIRAELDLQTVVKPGEEVEFCFTNLDIASLSNSSVTVQMLQEGFTYFGDTMEIKL